jgi:hypothetical protein
LSETNSRLNCWNVEGAYFNVSCTVVIEEKCQKSKKNYHIRQRSNVNLFGAQRRETANPLHFLELKNATFDCGRNTRQLSTGMRSHERKFTGPKKRRWVSLRFFKTTARLTICELWSTSRRDDKGGHIFEHYSVTFKGSKGGAIRFLRRIVLALRRKTICQRLPKDFEQKFLNYQGYITNLSNTGNYPMGQIDNAY